MKLHFQEKTTDLGKGVFRKAEFQSSPKIPLYLKKKKKEVKKESLMHKSIKSGLSPTASGLHIC